MDALSTHRLLAVGRGGRPTCEWRGGEMAGTGRRNRRAGSTKARALLACTIVAGLVQLAVPAAAEEPFAVSLLAEGVVRVLNPPAVTLGDVSLFVGNQGGDAELWRSDGTSDGTFRVKDINPSGSGLASAPFVQLGALIYFSANDGGGFQLWKTDGTADGTSKVAAVPVGTLARAGDGIVFSSGARLWRMNAAETVEKVEAEEVSSCGRTSGLTLDTATAPSQFTTISSSIVLFRSTGVRCDTFIGVDGVQRGVTQNFDALWRTDGTDSGTYLMELPDRPILVAGDATDPFATAPGVVGTPLAITASGTGDGYGSGAAPGLADEGSIAPGIGEELWRYDGTTDTVTFFDLNTTAVQASSSPARIYASPVGMWFSADDGVAGRELWTLPFSAGGPQPVTDLNPGGSGIGTPFATWHDNQIFFAGDNGTQGTELWRTNGTPAGTHLVSDIYPGDHPFFVGPASGNPAGDPGNFERPGAGYAMLDGQLIFAATTSIGEELWASDGTEAGTRLVADLSPGSDDPLEGSFPRSFVEVGNSVVFSAGTPGDLYVVTGGEEPPPPPPNLTITKQLLPGPLGGSDPIEPPAMVLGSPYRFKLTVTNESDTLPYVGELTVTDDLFGGREGLVSGPLSYLGFSGDGWSCTGNPVVACTRTDLGAGESSTVTLDVRLVKSVLENGETVLDTEVSNVAILTPDGPEGPNDDNSSETVVATTHAYDLRGLWEPQEDDLIIVGQEHTESVTVTNVGDADAPPNGELGEPTAVEVEVDAGDAPVTGLVLQGPPGWNCIASMCTYAEDEPMVPGAAHTFTTTFTVDAGAAEAHITATVVAEQDNAYDRDDTNNTATITRPVIIHAGNTAPVVTAGPDQQVDEGTIVTVSAAFTDPDGPPEHTGTVDWDDGAGPQEAIVAGGVVGATRVLPQNGTRTVRLCVTDGLGATGCDTAVVTVANVAPTVNACPEDPGIAAIRPWSELTAAADDCPIIAVAVNQSFQIVMTAEDPGADELTAAVASSAGEAATLDVAVAQTEPGETATITVGGEIGATGTHTVDVTVNDRDGGETIATRTVVVEEAPDLTIKQHLLDPDLPGIKDPPTVVLGDAVQFELTVTNDSQTDYAGDFEVRWRRAILDNQAWTHVFSLDSVTGDTGWSADCPEAGDLTGDRICTHTGGLPGGETTTVVLAGRIIKSQPDVVARTREAWEVQANVVAESQVAGNDAAEPVTFDSLAPDITATLVGRGTDPPAPGEPFGFDLHLVNEGEAATSTDWTVVFGCGDGCDFTDLLGPNDVSCELPTRTCNSGLALQPGDEVTISGDIVTTAVTTITASVTIGQDNASNATSDIFSEMGVEFGAQPDLTITKTATSDALLNDLMTFEITVSNAEGAGPVGSDSAITVSDIPGTGVILDGTQGTSMQGEPGDGWTCDVAGRKCTHPGPLAPGGSFPAIPVVVLLDNDAHPATTNTATVDLIGETEEDTSNNQSVAEITPAPPNLIIDKELIGEAVWGQIATFRITVTNLGLGNHVGPIDIVESLGEGLAIDTTKVDPTNPDSPQRLPGTGVSGDGWECGTPVSRQSTEPLGGDPAVEELYLGTEPFICSHQLPIPAGEALPVLEVTAFVTDAAAGGTSNSALLDVTGPQGDQHVNEDAFSVDVLAPDLQVTHDVSTLPVTLGQVEHVDFTVENVGTADWSGPVTLEVDLYDFLDDPDAGEFHVIAVDGVDWECDVAGRPTCVHDGPLPRQTSLPTVTMTVDPYVNIVTEPRPFKPSGAVQPEPLVSDVNDANDTTESEHQVLSPDLFLQKTLLENAAPGGTATFELEVHNLGDGDTARPLILQELPQFGVTVQTMAGTGWDCTVETLTCIHAGPLPAGETLPDKLTVTATIADDAPSPAANTARIEHGRRSFGRWERHVADNTARLEFTPTDPEDPEDPEEPEEPGPPTPTCDGVPATIVGTDGPDTLTGTADADVIVGLGGNDTISGLTGDDLICAGPGKDTVDAGPGNDTVFGGAGKDKIFGGDGEDHLHGEGGNDELIGDADDDEIHGGADNDKAWGEGGNDEIDLGEGDDQGIGGAGADIINGGEGKDRIGGGAGDDQLHGGPGDDVINGNSGNDTIHGNEGYDQLWGGDGNDEVHGDEGPDRVIGDGFGDAPGDDTLFGGPGDDWLHAVDESDTLHGGPGDDYLHCGVANDPDDTCTAHGGDGHDKIKGSFRDDRLFGGDGNDRIEGDYGQDLIEGGPGHDWLHGGGHSDTINGGPGNDLINGEALADQLDGGEGDDFIYGGGGTDTIFGGPGNDTIFAEEHDDTVFAGPGDDFVDGGDGFDFVDGGDGFDVCPNTQGERGNPGCETVFVPKGYWGLRPRSWRQSLKL